MKKLLLISADGHVGPRLTDYASLLEEKYRDGVESLIEQSTYFVENTWPIAKDAAVRAVVDPLDEAAGPCKEALWDPARRLAELEREGCVAEVLFPGDPASVGLYFSNMNDSVSAEYRAAGVRAYNRWLADFCSYAPGRFFGIAQTEPWPDMSACLKEIEFAKRHGMVAVALPRFPGIEPNQPPLTDRCWEPFWAACADNDLTVSLHIGHLSAQGTLLPNMKTLKTRETGFPDMAADGTIPYDPGRRPFWQMMMSGVFDRYPKLRVTFSELRTEWVAPTLAHLESRFDALRFSGHPAKLPKLRPTDYWRQNCGLSHMLTPYDMALRHQIGVDNIMFGMDFPHIEGSWPNTREWLRMSMKGVPEPELRRILGENAARFYQIDINALLPHVERVGLGVEEILGGHAVAQAYIDSFEFRGLYMSRPNRYDPREIDPILDEDQAATLLAD